MSDDEKVRDRLPDLIAAHPKLFRGQPPRVHSYLLQGWFALVDALCTDVEQLLGDQAAAFQWEQIKEKFGSARLYWSLRDRQQALVADVGGAAAAGEPDEGPDEEGYIERVDPTPLGLRISFTPADDLSQRIAARVRQAEQASAAICETCGAKGRLRTTKNGYYFTACPAHTPRGAVTAETWRRRREEEGGRRRDQ